MDYYYNHKEWVTWIFLGYAIGSIPFGYIIVKLRKGIDIRTVGSRNIGATNVGRILGLKWGILCFLLDGAKGFVPTYLIHRLIINYPYYDILSDLLIGLGIIIGHIFPLYISFRGGKGVATAFGVFLALECIPTLIITFIWLIFLALFRYVSLASIIAATLLPLSYWLIVKNHSSYPSFWINIVGVRILFVTVTCIIVAGLVIIKHIPNIKRLIKGTEPKVWLWKKPQITQINIDENK